MENYFLNRINRIKLDFIDLIVVLSYYLFSVLLILSLFGLFNIYWISGALLIILFFVFFFRRQPIFSKYYLYFFIFVPLLFIGFLLFRGFFIGDAIAYWLPWVREIVLQGRMPDFLLNIHCFINSRMPFMPLLFAAVFTFLPFKEIFVVIIPLFFVAATTLLLYQWAKDKRINKLYLIFIVLLFLANPVAMKYGWDIFQEPLIIFFFTAFFYYLEKYQRSNNIFYFFLMLFSCVLAIASKLTGLFLLLPLLIIIIRNKELKKYCLLYSVFIFLPVIIWFTRNYIIYGNPVSLWLNELFKGKYYEYIKISQLSYNNSYPEEFGSFFYRIYFVIKKWFFIFPFILLSFYGLWKEKRWEYIISVPIFIILLGGAFNGPNPIIRYSYPLLGFLLIYALIGLKYVESRLLISLIFFVALFNLLKTKIYISESYFISSFEKLLNIFLVLSQFIYQYRLAVVIVLSLFFYFFLSNKKHWQYLILLIFSFYLVTLSTIQVSWLNIWLPILFLIFVVLIWRYLSRCKELFLRRLILSFIVILLILNSWGLALAFFVANGQFVFPKMEAYGILPEAASQIKNIEGDNKDFYIYVAAPNYLSWYHNYKIVGYGNVTFYYITDNLQSENDLTIQELHSIFKENNIKYIIKNEHSIFWQDLFSRIGQEPDLFKVVFDKLGFFLWKVIQ